MNTLLPILFAIVLLVETVVLTVIYATAPPAPSDPLSIWLGTLGLLSMMVAGLYSIARRSRLIQRIMELRFFLHGHIFLALQGFLFVVFHSLPMFWNSRFMWLNPAVLNFVGVVVVVLTGIFGRWLFQQVPRTLAGRHMAARDVEEELHQLDAKVPSEVSALWARGQVTTVFGIASAAVRRFVALRRLRGLQLEPAVATLARRRLVLEHQKAALTVTQKVFRWWILIHRVMAVCVYILSAMHVVIAFMFTPSLRFL